MTTTMPATDLDRLVGRYVAVWSQADPELRRSAITDLWAPGGAEFIEGTQFHGHRELEARIGEAYREFVESGRYTVASAGDTTSHGNIIMFTVRLIHNESDKAGEVAWAARVFLVLDDDGHIHQDYQLTVKPLDPA